MKVEVNALPTSEERIPIEDTWDIAEDK